MTLLCVSLLGCDEHPISDLSTLQERLHSKLSRQYRSLIDRSGLFFNPAVSETPGLDIYNSAMLITASADVGLDTQPVNLTTAMSREVIGDSANRVLPVEWQHLSIALLALAQGERIALPSDDPPDSTAAPDDHVTGLWISAVVDQASARHTPDVAAMLHAAALDRSLHALAEWRAVDGCERENVDCTEAVRPLEVQDAPSGSITWALNASAYVGLAHRGYTLIGGSVPEIVRRAKSVLRKLPEGNDVQAAALAQAIYGGAGDRADFAAYIQRSQDRFDHQSGLYRQYVEFLGTIDSTYEAMRALGQRFPPLARRFGTYLEVRRRLAHDATTDGVTKARAIAVLASGAALSPSERETRDSIVGGLEHTTYPAEEAGSVTATLEALRSAGSTVPGVAITPAPLSDAVEGTVDATIMLAQDRALTNSDAIIAYYGRYVRGLPRTIIEDGSADPRLFMRLAVLDGSDTDWGPFASALHEVVDPRLGCPGLADMARATGAGAHPRDCDLTQTALFVNTQFGVAYEGGSR